MKWRFDPEQCLPLSAPEYLKTYPSRGRPLRIRNPELTFYCLKDCLCVGERIQTVMPDHGGGAPVVFRETRPYAGHDALLVQDAHNALEALEARERLEHAESVVELDEAVPLYPPGAENLWHWTTESLPKLLALENAGYGGRYIIPAHSRVARASLAMHGIAPERIRLSGPAYAVRLLMLPQRLSGFSLAENMPLAGFLRDRLLGAAGTLPGGKRCYIRRTGRRRVANEGELLELLREFDFEIMTPEDMDLAAQWRFMTNCECSLMAHGANATLTLLQRPGSGFVELFGNRYVSHTNLHAVRLLSLRYHPVVEELDVSSCPDTALGAYEYLQNGSGADITADLLHVRILLETLLRKSFHTAL